MTDINEKFPNDIIMHSFISFEELKKFSTENDVNIQKMYAKKPLLLCMICGLENVDLDSIYEGLILRQPQFVHSMRFVSPKYYITKISNNFW